MAISERSDDEIQVVFDPPTELSLRDKSIAEKRVFHGMTHQQLADEHSVCTKTVQRTLDHPIVADYVQALEREMYEQSTAQRVALRQEALDTLLRIMRTGPDSIAARVADKFYDQSLAAMAEREVKGRLETLVAALEEKIDELR